MKKSILLSLLFLFASAQLPAQLGLTVAPTQGFAKNWQVMVENYITGRRVDFLKYSNSATIDYTFQLSRPGWQIQPAVHGVRSHVIYEYQDFSVNSVGLLANVNIAPFIKSNNELRTSKSIFYLQFSPGLGYVSRRYIATVLKDDLPVDITLIDKSLALNFGLNILLEIKLTQLLTLSPQVGIRYFPNLEWEGFTEMISDGEFTDEYDKVNWRHYTFGLRIGLNLESLSK